jgi:hypothetical protein
MSWSLNSVLASTWKSTASTIFPAITVQAGNFPCIHLQEGLNRRVEEQPDLLQGCDWVASLMH